MNVLLFVADDMRPQLGAYHGSSFPSPVHPPMHTPNIDALANRSLFLRRAYVQQAVCSPSRSSILTGRRPDTTHVYDLVSNFRTVGGNFTTLPEYFKLNGYKTMGMGKIHHGTDASGGDDAQSWSEPYFHGVPRFEDKSRSWFAVPDNELTAKPLRDKQIADHAIESLRKLAPSAKTGESNFFVAVGFHKPHLPFVFPESIMQTFYPKYYIRLPPNPYAPVNMPNIAWFDYTELRVSYDDIAALNPSGAINTTLPDQVTLDLRRAYYSAVTWTDQLLGEVISELDRLGLSNSTIISFIGDHGFQLGEHGEWTKNTNFEIATRAPMMIGIPGVTDAGIQSDQLTEFVDLFPTLVEAAGLGSIPLCPDDSTHTALCREGNSLLPLIQDQSTVIKRAAFSQYPRGEHFMGYTVRTDLYRYTEWVRFDYAPIYKPTWSRVVGAELYDHVTDPEENYNGAHDAGYRRVRRVLRHLLHTGWRHNPSGINQIVG